MAVGNPILGNESGSVIVYVLLILAMVTVLGISSTNTSDIELKIVVNEKIYQANFYQAEAAVFEAVQELEVLDGITDYFDLMPTTSKLVWMNDQADAYFEDTSKWDNDGKDSNDNAAQAAQIAALAGTGNDCRYAVDYKGKQSGSSLKVGELSVNQYTLYGLSQSRGGKVLIDVGSKKPVINQ